MLIGQSGLDRSLWTPPGSSYGENAESISAIYKLLESRVDLVRLQVPPEEIPTTVDRLVLWDGFAMPDEEWEALMDWVAAGHTLVIAGEWDDGPQTKSGGLRTANPNAVHPAVAGVTKVQTAGYHFEPLDTPAVILLADAMGRPVIISEPHGSGQIIWSADVGWLTNDLIGEANNLELALGLLKPAPGKRLAFDEYHHGFTEVEHWWQILRGPLQLFVLQVGAALLLFFWAAGTRFGRPRPEPLMPARAAVEYVSAMSHLYRRSRARALVQRALYGSLMRTLGGLLGGVRGLSHAAIAERAAARSGLDQAKLEQTLDRLSQATPAEADLLTLARQAAEIQRSVRHAGYRDQRTAKD